MPLSKKLLNDFTSQNGYQIIDNYLVENEKCFDTNPELMVSHYCISVDNILAKCIADSY